MSKVIHFEIAAENPDECGKFYSEVFDWQIDKWEGPVDYWLCATGEKEKAGGKVLTPKMSVPGVGYMAYCSDNEGNIFGIMEENTSAE